MERLGKEKKTSLFVRKKESLFKKIPKLCPLALLMKGSKKIGIRMLKVLPWKKEREILFSILKGKIKGKLFVLK
jgi:hypothetical protein